MCYTVLYVTYHTILTHTSKKYKKGAQGNYPYARVLYIKMRENNLSIILSLKMAATYSPAGVQYHRRDCA